MRFHGNHTCSYICIHLNCIGEWSFKIADLPIEVCSDVAEKRLVSKCGGGIVPMINMLKGNSRTPSPLHVIESFVLDVRKN